MVFVNHQKNPNVRDFFVYCTPLAPDEEEIDVTPENPNANSAAGNANTKSGAVLNNWCFGGGSGGGGGGTQGPLAAVVVTGRRNVIISLRVFDRAHGGNGGGAGGGGNTRAMREVNQSTKACSDPKVDRAAAALASTGIAAFNIRVATVRTSDGKYETWGRDSGGTTEFELISSDCPNGGG